MFKKTALFLMDGFPKPDCKGKFRTIASVLFLHVKFFSVLSFTSFTTMFRRCNNTAMDRYEGGINVRMHERKVVKGVNPGGATFSLVRKNVI